MERRFEVRLNELRQDAVLDPAVFRDVLPRLERFVQPFVVCLKQLEQKQHAQHYLAGLVSDLQRKNVESIAYLHDQQRQRLQKFIGQVPWDWRPLQKELTRQVGRELGAADAVLVIDPSGFAKKGTESVGVQRQWCGRLGKIENCQVGVYLGYVSRVEHALVDMRLYLPQSWAKDRRRRKKCGVPKAVRFRTRHQLALEMIDQNGALLPHAWVSGDEEMGRSTYFRRELRARSQRYLLAVASNTLVRDLEVDPPAYAGRGRRPQRPFVRVQRWATAQSEDAWKTVEVRPGEKGPLVVQAIKRRVQAKTDRRRAGPEEMVVVFREQQPDATFKHDYYLSDAPAQTPLEEFARVAKARHRIEECLQRAKGEAGLAHYEVRTWEGWHHHQVLSLIATWFLTQESRRGKKMDAGDHGSTDPLGDRQIAAAGVGVRLSEPNLPHQHASPAA